jgi:glutaminyl-tRNA synthetase
MGTRQVPFSRVLYIERDDFRESPPKKYYRLFPNNEVRLRWAYLVRCTDWVTDERGEVVEVRCTYDPATRGGEAPDGRRPKATIHWVSAPHAVDAEVRLYDHLFAAPVPGAGRADEDWLADLNPASLDRLVGKLEPSLVEAAPGARYQFERNGYFCADTVDSAPGRPVWNRTATLRDTWARIERSG